MKRNIINYFLVHISGDVINEKLLERVRGAISDVVTSITRVRETGVRERPGVFGCMFDSIVELDQNTWVGIKGTYVKVPFIIIFSGNKKGVYVVCWNDFDDESFLGFCGVAKP